MRMSASRGVSEAMRPDTTLHRQTSDLGLSPTIQEPPPLCIHREPAARSSIVAPTADRIGRIENICRSAADHGVPSQL